MTIIQISDKFKDDETVFNYYEYVRWNNKPVCPHCANDKVSERYSDFRYHCPNCRSRFSVTTNTQLHQTHIHLRYWLFAFSLISNAKKGLSALQLHRDLGVSYSTAWSMYHRIREMMSDGRTNLTGIVEMDETYIGGKPRKFQSAKYGEPMPNLYLDEKLEKLSNKFDFSNDSVKKNAFSEDAPRGRGTSKTPVVGIIQRNGNVIAEVMQKTNFKNFKSMVEKYVNMPDSVLLTDEYSAYSRFDAVIEHIKIDHSKMYSYEGLNTNSIESFWAIVKRGIIGQYHQVSDKYLPNYIDEFCFKYNNRKFDDMFETLVFNSMLHPETIFKTINPRNKELKSGKKRARKGILASN
jgi:transposase-like protein/IS1 family transposase